MGFGGIVEKEEIKVDAGGVAAGSSG